MKKQQAKFKAVEHPGLINWLANGERGGSSNTIVEAITGIPCGGRSSHPYDPADVRRCRMLFKDVPTLEPYFKEVAKVSWQWKALINRWLEICLAIDSEAHTGMCPKAYNIMQTILYPKVSQA